MVISREPSKEFSAIAAIVGEEVDVTYGIADTAGPAELDTSEAEAEALEALRFWVGPPYHDLIQILICTAN